jgi:hypothetical protein
LNVDTGAPGRCTTPAGISPQSAVSNPLGEVSVRWTLGPGTGPQGATATAGTLGPIAISAIAN